MDLLRYCILDYFVVLSRSLFYWLLCREVVEKNFFFSKRKHGGYLWLWISFTQVWSKDVSFYCVKDSSGNPVAYFYFDPYSRPSEKRGGAWMDEVFSRSRVLSRDGVPVRLPIAHMVCNQTPPVGDKPSLMTFREVSAPLRWQLWSVFSIFYKLIGKIYSSSRVFILSIFLPNALTADIRHCFVLWYATDLPWNFQWK